MQQGAHNALGAHTKSKNKHEQSKKHRRQPLHALSVALREPDPCDPSQQESVNTTSGKLGSCCTQFAGV
eukprot:3283166-Pyramimonas_sp.AAC.1